MHVPHGAGAAAGREQAAAWAPFGSAPADAAGGPSCGCICAGARGACAVRSCCGLFTVQLQASFHVFGKCKLGTERGAALATLGPTGAGPLTCWHGCGVPVSSMRRQRLFREQGKHARPLCCLATSLLSAEGSKGGGGFGAPAGSARARATSAARERVVAKQQGRTAPTEGSFIHSLQERAVSSRGCRCTNAQRARSAPASIHSPLEIGVCPRFSESHSASKTL